MADLSSHAAAVARTLLARLEWAARRVDPGRRPDLAAALVQEALDEALDRLAASGCWGQDNRLPSSRLWQEAEPWLARGALQHRARFKPRGYAGDYQLLAGICSHALCDDPWGQAFDRFFLAQAACQGVRQRVWRTAGLLAEHRLRGGDRPYHAVSVGAGPGLDIRAGLELLPSQRREGLRVSLVDLDPEALDAAAGELSPWLAGPALACFRENLARLPQRPACPGGPADLLVCSGLLDYLDAEAAARLVGWFWSQLAPGGRLVVCNFAPENPSRAYMEWIGNWYLIYRDRPQMLRVAEQAGIAPGKARLTRDFSGTVWMLVADRD